MANSIKKYKFNKNIVFAIIIFVCFTSSVVSVNVLIFLLLWQLISKLMTIWNKFNNISLFVRLKWKQFNTIWLLVKLVKTKKSLILQVYFYYSILYKSMFYKLILYKPIFGKSISFSKLIIFTSRCVSLNVYLLIFCFNCERSILSCYVLQFK